MAKISLSRSFILRTRLRSIIENFKDALSTASTYIHESSVYSDGKVVKTNAKPFSFHDMDLAKTYDTFTKANNYMIILNNLIDEANVLHARKIINELEMEKNKTALLRHLQREQESFTETRDIVCQGDSKDSTYYVTENYKLTNDTDWKTLFTKNRKRISELEDKLSETNANSLFELPDEIISFISDNL